MRCWLVTLVSVYVSDAATLASGGTISLSATAQEHNPSADLGTLGGEGFDSSAPGGIIAPPVWWPMFHNQQSHLGFNPSEKTISKSNRALQLGLAWCKA